MTPPELIEALQWDAETTKKTRWGEVTYRTAELTPETATPFWTNWKSDPEAMLQAGLTPLAYDMGRWLVAQFTGRPPGYDAPRPTHCSRQPAQSSTSPTPPTEPAARSPEPEPHCAAPSRGVASVATPSRPEPLPLPIDPADIPAPTPQRSRNETFDESYMAVGRLLGEPPDWTEEWRRLHPGQRPAPKGKATQADFYEEEKPTEFRNLSPEEYMALCARARAGEFHFVTMLAEGNARWTVTVRYPAPPARKDFTIEAKKTTKGPQQTTLL